MGLSPFTAHKHEEALHQEPKPCLFADGASVEKARGAAWGAAGLEQPPQVVQGLVSKGLMVFIWDVDQDWYTILWCQKSL